MYIIAFTLNKIEAAHDSIFYSEIVKKTGNFLRLLLQASTQNESAKRNTLKVSNLFMIVLTSVFTNTIYETPASIIHASKTWFYRCEID